MSASPAPQPGPSSGPVNRHAPTPVERQRAQLDKLLKDPAKPAFIPAPIKEKGIRPPREMMKNVQGSSAGAGSGEFHVYKASRRREYERLKLMDETAQKELDELEFEQRKRERDEQAEAKTAKNRAKRQKKKGRVKAKGDEDDKKGGNADGDTNASEAPLKKRRLVNGQELVFKRPGEEESDNEREEVGPIPPNSSETSLQEDTPSVAVAETNRITIYED